MDAVNTLRLAVSLMAHRLLRWNARRNAAAQRKFAVQLEADQLAAERGIPFCDALANRYDAQVRALAIELRARRLARLVAGSRP